MRAKTTMTNAILLGKCEAEDYEEGKNHASE